MSTVWNFYNYLIWFSNFTYEIYLHYFSGIVLISAHWEEKITTILSCKKESNLLFDYYGFPNETYNIKYPIKVLMKLLISRTHGI